MIPFLKNRLLPISCVIGLAVACPFARATDITGAGATFPAPIYAKWGESYQNTGNHISYQAIGSRGGIKQILAKTVDFGATDMPLKPEELAQDGLVQFPTVIGGEVLVYNLPGIPSGQIHLTPTVLADIYLGKITQWNDKAHGLESESYHARTKHHCNTPVGCFGYYLCVHQLFVQGQSRMEAADL